MWRPDGDYSALRPRTPVASVKGLDTQSYSEQYMAIPNSINCLLGYLGPSCELWPCRHGIPHLSKQPGSGSDLETVSKVQQVFSLDVIEITVHRHQMLITIPPLGCRHKSDHRPVRVP